jgi:hypothetical protein
MINDIAHAILAIGYLLLIIASVIRFSATPRSPRFDVTILRH